MGTRISRRRIVCRQMGVHACHAQLDVLIEVGLKVETAAETFHVTDLQNGILVVVVERSIKPELLRTGIDSHIVIMDKSGTRNLVHMVVSLRIAYFLGRKCLCPPRSGSRFRTVREVVAAIEELLHSGKVDVGHVFLSIEYVIIFAQPLH